MSSIISIPTIEAQTGLKQGNTLKMSSNWTAWRGPFAGSVPSEVTTNACDDKTAVTIDESINMEEAKADFDKMQQNWFDKYEKIGMEMNRKVDAISNEQVKTNQKIDETNQMIAQLPQEFAKSPVVKELIKTSVKDAVQEVFDVSSGPFMMKTPANRKKRANSSRPPLSSAKKGKHHSALAIPGGSTRTHLSAQKHEYRQSTEAKQIADAKKRKGRIIS